MCSFQFNSLINPAPKSPSDLTATSRCDEFAVFFIDKITNIRLSINQDIKNDVCEPLGGPWRKEEEEVLVIVNHFLFTSIFSMAVKTAIMKPLLK